MSAPCDTPLVGGIEAGGTKFVLGIGEGVGRGPGTIIARTSIPTTAPSETLAAVKAWFATQPQVAAVGIATFGPAMIDPAAPDWGCIGKTPKPGWSGTPLAALVNEALGVPIGFDTDVNAAALAESRWGAGQGLASLVYLTVGTGVGGGAVVDGRVLHGFGHPEMGHLRLPRHPDDLGFAGICPFHGDCCEGLVSGPAILARWGASLSELSADHPAHGMVAWYLGQLANTLRAVLAPQRIVIGGGVSKAPGLHAAINEAARIAAAGYFPDPPAPLVTAPGLGEHSGLLGAFALAGNAIGKG